MNFFSSFFSSNNIKYYGAVSYDDLLVINARLLERTYFYERNTVICFAVPYYVGGEKRNISEYAVARDYHLYFSELYAELENSFALAYPENHIKCYADTSPFNERAYAEKVNIGKVGLNRLLINSEYGSYVYIGTIVTDLIFEHICDIIPKKVRKCIGCGQCIKKCPSQLNCLSAITQRKGELTESERMLIKKNGCAWGCDVCQEVCPANKALPATQISFFLRDRIPFLSTDILEGMSCEEFGKRAYAWKGKKCIMRNVKVLEDNE